MVSNLPARITTKLPAVTDNAGKPLAGPELESVIKLVTDMAQVANLARIRQALEREQIEGRSIEISLSVTAQMQVLDLREVFPYTPLATVAFYNLDDNGTAFISVNNAADFKTLGPNQSDNIDLTKAKRRAEVIYYYGDAITVRLQGTF